VTALNLALAAVTCGGASAAMFAVSCVLCGAVAGLNATICVKALVAARGGGLTAADVAPTKEFEIMRM
jgi:hypothetical protein